MGLSFTLQEVMIFTEISVIMNVLKGISLSVSLFIQLHICLANSAYDSVIVKILPLNKRELLLTKHSISEYKNERSILLTSVKSEIHDGVVYRDTIWIGTVDGLYTYSLKTGTLQSSNILSSSLSISRIKTDAEGSLWIASMNDGLWRIKNLKAEKVLDVSPVYSLEISKDSTVWAGSNVGLYKLKKQANSWQRYAEEGYSGYEIPDNIVENLFCDLHNNTWVIMPDEFAFIRSNEYEGHVPGFRNITSQDFELKYITEILSDQYLFITSKGIFLMPNSPEEHGHGGHEIKSAHDQKMYLLTNKQLSLRADLDAKRIRTAAVDGNGNLILSYDNTFYRIKRKTIKRIVKDLSKLHVTAKIPSQ